MVPKMLPTTSRPRSAGTPMMDAFAVTGSKASASTGQRHVLAGVSRCRNFSRCGSPALAARHSRFAQEGRQLCHLAAKEGLAMARAAEAKQQSQASPSTPEPEPNVEPNPVTAPPVPRVNRVAAGRAMALLQAASGKSPSPRPLEEPEKERTSRPLSASRFATAPAPTIIASLPGEPSPMETDETADGPQTVEANAEATAFKGDGLSSTAPLLSLPRPASPELGGDIYGRQVSAPASTSTAPRGGPRGRHLKVEDRSVLKSASPVPRSPRKAMAAAVSKEPWEEPRERIGWMPEKRFAHVWNQRGSRSLTPTKREGSWRGPEHLPVDCVIRRSRRGRKGPKEKLLILPCLCSLDDPRFRHLFETLEANQPELLSESILNLHGFSGVRVN